MPPALASRYARVAAAVAAASRPEDGLEARMKFAADELWREFGGHRPVSWVGFYFLRGEEMTLGPRRDKPACSPIGLHGACGQAALSGKTLVVRDVKDLGESYIACDPRDRSEIVVPVFGPGCELIAVLDVDSAELATFDEEDRSGLEGLLAWFREAS